jgi:FixJ family two-component response regulator
VEDAVRRALRRGEICVSTRPTLVVVVDDDESVRESLPDLLMTFGYESIAFASAEDCLRSDVLLRTGCLILDVALPGMSGPELRQELIRRGLSIPTVFITAQTEQRVRAVLRDGSVGCLFKPFGEKQLRAALDAAMPQPQK